jgi:hypothetical protein
MKQRAARQLVEIAVRIKRLDGLKIRVSVVRFRPCPGHQSLKKTAYWRLFGFA